MRLSEPRVLYVAGLLVVPAFLLWEAYTVAQTPAYQPFLPAILPASLLALVYWYTGASVLLRYFHRLEARLLFGVSQALGVALWAPLAYRPPHAVPYHAFTPSVIALHFAAPLLLHLHLTFPVFLGGRWLRQGVLGGLYGVGALASWAWWLQAEPWWQVGLAFTAMEILAASLLFALVYWQRASTAHRRRLRLIVLGTVPSALFMVGLDLLPALAGHSPTPFPAWALAALLSLSPVAYAYAVTRQDLLGVDQILNRALVFIILSLGIFGLYLGPVWLLSQRFALDSPQQLAVVALITLLVGWSFNSLQRQVQRWVDVALYGGWYDYPQVVGRASEALQHSKTREHIRQVLTEQVPAAMRIHRAALWLGELPGGFPLNPEWAQFRYDFATQPSACWCVGRHQDGEPLSSLDHRILSTIAAQAEIALSNILLIEALQQQLAETQANQRMLTQMQHQLLRSREAERARLARDLHDSPVQSLVGLNLQLGLLRQQAGLPPALHLPLETIHTEVRHLLNELRQVCTDLRPPMLDTLGLGAALQAYAAQWQQQHAIPLRLDLPPDLAPLRRLPSEVAVNLFRVAQEALGNIARHAQASQALLRLRWDGHGLEMVIEDDGQGFAQPETFSDLPAGGHFGLVGMRERVELIGGRFAFHTAPGQGTRVQVWWETPPSMNMNM